MADEATIITLRSPIPTQKEETCRRKPKKKKFKGATDHTHHFHLTFSFFGGGG